MDLLVLQKWNVILKWHKQPRDWMRNASCLRGKDEMLLETTGKCFNCFVRWVRLENTTVACNYWSISRGNMNMLSLVADSRSAVRRRCLNELWQVKPAADSVDSYMSELSGHIRLRISVLTSVLMYGLRSHPILQKPASPA